MICRMTKNQREILIHFIECQVENSINPSIESLKNLTEARRMFEDSFRNQCQIQDGAEDVN